MKLYKFRSLENFERIEDILSHHRFYMTNWRELNDPMEGHFNSIYYNDDVNYKALLQDFINYKVSLKICSFSAIINPILLWLHYADQHKGIAIEIKLNPSRYTNLYKVNYVRRIPEIDFASNPTPIQVLTNKIHFWKYEKEYRVIDDCRNIRVGRITGIYFGVRTSIDDKERIQDLVQNNIKLYNTKIDFNNNTVQVKH
jgi:hypothetical protein